MTSNILVIAPHADDEVLGCGATIAKHVQSGHSVTVAILTNSHVGAPEICTAKMIEEVREEAEEANGVLGVHQLKFYNLPSPRLDTMEQYKIANKMLEIIVEVQPKVVYIPFKGDLHLDHSAVYNAVLVACRPNPRHAVREIYCYETLSETEWGHPTADHAFVPTMFNILTPQQISLKLKAMQKYRSQLRIPPNTRSLEAIEAQAQLRGFTVGHHYAEAFVTVRQVLE